jgi:hypothetical protein
MQILANRALGILAQFLIKNKFKVDVWLLPSTCCFSVAALFRFLGIHFIFYDFSFKVIDIVKNKEKLNPQYASAGLLLVDYFGVSWSDSAVLHLRNIFKLVVHDACLSDVNVNIQSSFNTDLTVFSTGSGKSIDVGYGGIGYTSETLELKDIDHTSMAMRYEWLDRYWKSIITETSTFDHSTLKEPWVDISSNKISTDYINAVLLKTTKTKQKRILINKVYQTQLPTDFLNFPQGHWRFNILVDYPEVIISELKSYGLMASRHYVSLARRFNQETMIHSELIERHIINLFNGVLFNVEDAIRCSEVISNLYRIGKIRPIEKKFEMDFA